MARIEVLKAPTPKSESDPLTLLARLCYFYPQYTLAQARRLPYRHVKLLLREAERQEAARYYNLTQIAAAPHTEKGKAVKELSDSFKKAMNG